MSGLVYRGHVSDTIASGVLLAEPIPRHGFPPPVWRRLDNSSFELYNLDL